MVYRSAHVELRLSCPDLLDPQQKYSTSPNELGLTGRASYSHHLIAEKLVNVLWIEDGRDFLELPGRLGTSAMLYLAVIPMHDVASDGLYLVRIIAAEGSPFTELTYVILYPCSSI